MRHDLVLHYVGSPLPTDCHLPRTCRRSSAPSLHTASTRDACRVKGRLETGMFRCRAFSALPVMNSRKCYPSDLTDNQWLNILHLFPGCDRRPRSLGRPRTYDRKDILDAVLYLARTGSQWRSMPHDSPSRTKRQPGLPPQAAFRAVLCPGVLVDVARGIFPGPAQLLSQALGMVHDAVRPLRTNDLEGVHATHLQYVIDEPLELIGPADGKDSP
jgi:transposase